MGFYELLVVVCSFLFTGYCISKIVEMIKSWINRKKPTYDQEKFDRLAKAFIQYKKRSEHRIEELEGAINKGDSKLSNTADKTIEKKPNKSIEIEPEQPKSQTQTNSGKMKNMLRDSG